MTEPLPPPEGQPEGGVWARFVNRDPFPVWVWRDPQDDEDLLRLSAQEVVRAIKLNPRQILEMHTPIPEIASAAARPGRGLSAQYAAFLRSLSGYLYPEEAALLQGARAVSEEPLGFRAGTWRHYRERYAVVYENGVVAICMSEKTANEVKDALCPTYGKVVKEVLAVEFAKAE